MRAMATGDIVSSLPESSSRDESRNSELSALLKEFVDEVYRTSSGELNVFISRQFPRLYWRKETNGIVHDVLIELCRKMQAGWLPTYDDARKFLWARANYRAIDFVRRAARNGASLETVPFHVDPENPASECEAGRS